MPEKSELQKLIDSLEEYEQGIPKPAILRDFIKEKVWQKIIGKEMTPTKETTETCNVITLGHESDEEEDEDEEKLLNYLFDETENRESNVVLRSGTKLPERTANKQNETTNKSKDKQVNEDPSTSKTIPNNSGLTIGDYNVLAHLRKIPI